MIHHPGQDNTLLFDSFCSLENIIHFSTTRKGGYSTGNYDSFNLSYFSGDREDNVRKNREKLCNCLSIRPETFFVPYQVHQTEIIIIDDAFLHVQPLIQQQLLHGKDALLTSCKGICIAVATADCVPVLLYAEDRRVIGAVHAGWRGSCERILQQTIRKMVVHYQCDPSNIHAVIGPSISKETFETGNEVFDAFKANGFDMTSISFKHPITHKYHIDLWETNRQQLILAGVPDTQIEISGQCTYRESDIFFSARKSGIHSGRMLTGICLR